MRPQSPRPLSSSVLAWLRCFEAAARCGSFTKAAQELHISAGAISQQVKKLEERFDRALFLRTQEGLTLTAAGDQLYSSTRDAMRGLESAVHRLETINVGEPVNVSCSPSFAMFWLTLRLGSFYRAYPHMALRIVGESDRVDQARMTNENIAVAIRFDAQERDDSGSISLFEEWLVPVATPSFMQAHPELRTPQDLHGTHLLHAADPWESIEATEEWTVWLAAVGADLPAASLRQGTQFNHAQLSIQAALGGQGIAMGRLALVLRYLQQGRLIVPFPRRVGLNTAYRLTGHASHADTATVFEWLLGEAEIFRNQRDTLFKDAGIEVA